ncbi:phage tail protein [Streptomyces violascens]|uniref:phage tail protein n=1 Tax=Streptomyces violascens TaxID=67381 RepID=UPI0036973D5F
MAENIGSEYRSDCFEFQMDGITVTTLKKVDGLAIEVETATVITTDGKGKNVTQTFAGAQKPPIVTLTRGMAKPDALTEWLKKSTTGPADKEKKNVSITYKTADGKDKLQWDLKGAWVSSYRPGSLDVSSGQPLDETFTIACDEATIK